MTITRTVTGSRNIAFLGSDDWVRVISLVSIIQFGALIIGGTVIIIGRQSGYIILNTDTIYIAISTSVSICGFYLGIILHQGVDEGNPKKLLAWIFYAGYIQFLLIFNFFIYLAFYPNSLNLEDILGLVVCLLIYGIFIYFVNIHRQELEAAIKQRDNIQIAMANIPRIRSPSPPPPVP